MHTNLPKKTIFKSMALRKEYPFPQFKVVSYKRRPRDQAFFWRHNNTVSRGRGERRISTPTLD